MKEKKKIKLSPDVKATYKYIIQEMTIIERALKPLQKHLIYLQEQGLLED